MGVAVVRHSTQQGLPGSAAIPITCKEPSKQPTEEGELNQEDRERSFLFEQKKQKVELIVTRGSAHVVLGSIHHL